MTAEEFRTVLRNLSKGAIVEAAVDLVLVVGLVVATISAPNGIPKILAALAIGIIIVGWVVAGRRLLRRK